MTGNAGAILELCPNEPPMLILGFVGVGFTAYCRNNKPKLRFI
jgi:hypothetical protein